MPAPLATRVVSVLSPCVAAPLLLPLSPKPNSVHIHLCGIWPMLLMHFVHHYDSCLTTERARSQAVVWPGWGIVADWAIFLTRLWLIFSRYECAL